MSALGPVAGVAELMALRAQVMERQGALREVRAASMSPAAAGAPVMPAAGFAATLDAAMRQVSAVQHRSSDLQTAYESGQVTDIAQVMIARQEAGIAFEAALQTRNKLLSAYQDIMRMGG
ncbi:MAG: flagellar hook-basal body complex protein FliE [Erythrobacter sp. SCN 62-14]|nr:MAG: flagellar hook-basal body complex protein FliE [Erythrobacter sp. SCN 62-14]